MEKQGVPIYKHLGGETATPEPVGSEGGGGWSPRNLVCSRRHLGNQDTLAAGGWFYGLGPLGLWEEATGTRTRCVGVVNLCPVHTPHFPFPHLGAWPARHSRYAQSESWAGPGLSCEERTFQEAASGTQSPERGPAGTRVSRPAPHPHPRHLRWRNGRRGCNVFHLPHLPLLSAPPPSASHPFRAVTCAGKGPLEVGGASIPGYPGLSKTLERVVFYGGSCPSPIRLCNRLCSFHRWLPPPSPEMSGRRLPVSYTGAPQSLGAPSPRVWRWRCC